MVVCAFKRLKDAEAYSAELNGDKDKAVACCKELIALRESESMVRFLNIEYEITAEYY